MRISTLIYLAILILTALMWSAQLMAEGIAFFSHEGNSNGQYKICYYDYLGSQIAITVPSYSVCPVTIRVP